MIVEVGTDIQADARRLLEAMEADVADGFMEELDYRLDRIRPLSPSSPTKPWKTLRVYHAHFEKRWRVSNSSHSLAPSSIGVKKPLTYLHQLPDT